MQFKTSHLVGKLDCIDHPDEFAMEYIGNARAERQLIEIEFDVRIAEDTRRKSAEKSSFVSFIKMTNLSRNL